MTLGAAAILRQRPFALDHEWFDGQTVAQVTAS
jgi:hypothetical protein